MRRSVHLGQLGVVLSYLLVISGCDSQQADNQPSDSGVDTDGPAGERAKVRSAGDSPVISGALSIDDAVHFCRYNSPFNFGSRDSELPECKAYLGSLWTEEEAELDCALPFGPTFAEVKTSFSTTPCDVESSLAFCTMNADYNDVTVTCFYETVPAPGAGETGLDFASTKAGCEGFGGGIFETTGDDVIVTPSGPLLPGALEACKSTSTVSVTPDQVTDEQLSEMRANGGYLYFEPVDENPKSGVIVFPGAFVDSRAYAPAAQILANAGIAVALLPVPEYMAIAEAAADRPSHVMTDHKDVGRWFVAGHSVGGVAAAKYAHGNTAPLRGLIILGSYVPSEYDMSDRNDLVGLVAVGSEEESGKEGTESYENFLEGKGYSPSETTFLIIEGGYHFGFCYQESVERDETPGITLEQQHKVFTDAIIARVLR